MPEPRHWYLFLYDVSDPTRLRRVHRVLTSWGQPVQYSVFRVRCIARGLERLRFELSEILTDDDRLLVVRLCAGCASRVSVHGQAIVPFELDGDPFLIV